MSKKKAPAKRSPARKKTESEAIAKAAAAMEAEDRESLRLARKEFLDFVRTEQTFEEARRMLERVTLKMAGRPIAKGFERLMRQLVALKLELRDEEGRLEERAQGGRR